MVILAPAGQRALRRGRVSLPGCAYVVTTVTAGRAPLFGAFAAARVVVRTLAEVAAERATASLAFVVMPDHVHWLLVLGDAPLEDVVRGFKGRSAWRLGRESGLPSPTWQRGYHDRALRADDDLRVVARYVVGNPVRAGLVSCIGDYPHWDCAWDARELDP